MKALVVALLLVNGLLWGYIFGSLQTTIYTEKHVMKEICDYSYTVISGEWEDACGLAQHISGEEYIR